MAVTIGVAVTIGAIAALQPAAALSAGIIVFLVGCFILDPRAALLPMFLWLLFQNSLIAMLDARGLGGVTAWLRRSDELLFLVLVIVALLDQSFRRGRATTYGVAVPVVAVAVVAGLTALRVGHAPLFAASLDLVLLLKGGWVFIAVAHAADDDRRLNERAILLAVVAAGAFAGGVACVELVDPAGFRAFVGLPTALDVRGGWHSLQGPFVHPGVFGWFMAICAVICVAFIATGESRWWIGLVPFMLGILASGRRKPLAGVLVATIVLVWMSSPRTIRWRRVLWATGGLSVFVILFWPFVEDLLRSALQNYVFIRNPLTQARDVLYLASAMLASRHFPLGAGPGLFGGYAARLYYSPLYVQLGINHVWGLSPGNPIFLDDTFWPHVLGEFGIVGVVAYAWFLFAVARRAIRATKGQVPPAPLIARVGIALLAEALVESIASAGFEQSLQAMVTFGGLALAAGAAAAAERTSVRLTGAGRA